MEGIRIQPKADPSTCPLCGGEYKQIIPEIVKCSACGFEEKSTFGIVKEYIEENGIPTILAVAKGCNVPVRKIDNFLRNGQLEIPESSEVFIKCRRCGIDIRFGKYCKECATILARDLSKSFEIKESEIGEVPKKKQGKMRYINKE
ncbi:hypothetical protein [Konateibacter massiliensis]|uniref:hypothetical protein n=1 Tax=Konateibacter massiliensis TaxID=2002841 RepID=UPI000C15D171|nr:hypothetical protein [Konateibacter massiliensis]